MIDDEILKDSHSFLEVALCDFERRKILPPSVSLLLGGHKCAPCRALLCHK